MQRTNLDLPSAFPFETRLDVRVGDINYGGHLGNDALLTLLQEARLRFLAAKGFSETNAGGCGLAMVEALVQYRAQAFRDDRLKIEVAIGGLSRVGFDVFYRVTREGDGMEIARARTAMVFFDYARGRLSSMPDAFRVAWVGNGAQDDEREKVLL